MQTTAEQREEELADISFSLIKYVLWVSFMGHA